MITVKSSLVLDCLNWPDPHKFFGFGQPLTIYLLQKKKKLLTGMTELECVV